MKYKVGQKVRVRNLKDGYRSPDGTLFTKEMESIAGTIVTIDQVRLENYHIKEDHREWYWVDDFFEDVEFSKDLITDLSLVTLENGDRLIYIKERDEFKDLIVDYDNGLGEIEDIESDGYVGKHKIVKIEQPEFRSVYSYSDNVVKEMTVEEISKTLGYEVKIVKEK